MLIQKNDEGMQVVGGMDHDDKSGCTKSFSVKDCFQVQDGSYAGTGGKYIILEGLTFYRHLWMQEKKEK